MSRFMSQNPFSITTMMCRMYVRDVIRITGQKDNCEAAKQALLDLVPAKEITAKYGLNRPTVAKQECDGRELMSHNNVEPSSTNEQVDVAIKTINIDNRAYRHIFGKN